MLRLDDSHGGADIGMELNGRKEKDVTLQLARATMKVLDGVVACELLRVGDEYVSLNDRLKKINQPGGWLNLSFHLEYNPGDPEKWSIGVYYLEGNDMSRRIAEIFSKGISHTVPGISVFVFPSRFYLIRKSLTPTILIRVPHLLKTSDLNASIDGISIGIRKSVLDVRTIWPEVSK